MSYHVNFTLHCMLTEYSLISLIRGFIVSLVYNNGVCLKINRPNFYLDVFVCLVGVVNFKILIANPS